MLRRPAAVAAAIFAAVVIADQATKAAVRSTMQPVGTSLPILGDFLRLTHVSNTGAAFGMLPDHAVVFVGVSCLVLAAAAVYWWRVRPVRAAVVVPIALLTAGAFGNLIDRAVRGSVTDFIWTPWIPVFNVADSAITVGVALLMWWLLFGPADHDAAAGVVRARTEDAVGTDAGAGGPKDGPLPTNEAPGEGAAAVRHAED